MNDVLIIDEVIDNDINLNDDDNIIDNDNNRSNERIEHGIQTTYGDRNGL